MLIRLCVSALVVLAMATASVSGQTPSLAAFDEATLRRAGVATEAASLLRLLHEHTRTDGDPEKIKSLIAQLASPQFERREDAARQLIVAGRPALPSLQEARKHHEDPEVRQAAAHCVGVLDNLLDPNLTMAAVRRLSQLRASGAAGPFLAVLPCVDWEIQDEILHDLPHVALRDGSLDPALLAALTDEVPLRRAAAALAVALTGSAEQRTQVRKLLNDPNAAVRLRAAQGLLAVHEAQSLPTLIALLNEPAVEISWSAEELLHWVAGATAPEAKVGAASSDERKKAVDAWTAWHESFGRHLDWNQLEQAPRRPGLYLACDDHSLWLGGCDGIRRWSQSLKYPAHDATLLPGNRVLVVPANAQTEVFQADLEGKVLWSHRQVVFHDFVVCQRLPNGHCLLVSDMDAVEITTEGREVSQVAFEESLGVRDAWQPRSGPLFCRTRKGWTALDHTSGRVIHTADMPGYEECQGKIAVHADGRCALADGKNRLLETNGGGQILRVLPVYGARSVEALRNGHYLVAASGVVLPHDPDLRLLELDAAGHTVWEVPTPYLVNRVRCILDTVRIGFDKPRPTDFNLDAPAQRIHALHNPDPQVRGRSLRMLQVIQPRDSEMIAAIVAVLDDPASDVRHSALSTLATLGEPAVAPLLDAWRTKKGNERLPLVTAMKLLGPAAHPAIPELIALLEDAKTALELRREAVAALAEIGPDAKPAVPILLKYLKGDCGELRCMMPDYLTKIAPDDPAVHAGLLIALRDLKHLECRAAVLEVLPRIGHAAKITVPTLIDILKSPTASCTMRCQAAMLCCSLGKEGEPALPVLIDLIKDVKQSAGLRSDIAVNFASLRGDSGRRVIPVCGELLREPNLPGNLEEHLFCALQGIGPDSVPLLARVVNDENDRRRHLAMRALGDLGVHAAPALPALELAAKDKDAEIRERAERTISTIKGQLSAITARLN